MPERTLAASTRKLQGVGLHTGTLGWVRVGPLHSYPSDSSNTQNGIYFRNARTQELILVQPELVSDTRRCTALLLGQSRLSTVEHLLAALTGCGVTDAIIEFDAEEVPILDGSAYPFAEAFREAGFCDLEDLPPVASIHVNEVAVVTGSHGERLIALPSDKLSVTVVLDYSERSAIGTQSARYVRGETNFLSQIAPARTYGFLSEFEQVKALGLATGASLENCIALHDDGSPDDRTPLRFPNELARHKLLDVLGDLTLAGRPIVAEIIAVRPSHTVNCLLASRLASLAASPASAA